MVVDHVEGARRLEYARSLPESATVASESATTMLDSATVAKE
jgi:hypothetical protein